MGVFNDKAKIVADGLATTQKMDASQVQASPFLDFLMQLMQQLMPMLLSCLVPHAPAATVKSALNSPNFFQRWHMRRVIRQSIGDDPAMQGMLAGPLQQEMLKMGAGCTEADAQAMLDEYALTSRVA